jgi:hypothetical protein
MQHVANRSYGQIQSGEIAGSATAKQLPNIACELVSFIAAKSNAGQVYLGGAGGTKPDGTQDATTGYELKPSAQTPWFPVENLNRFYIICDNAGDDLTYLALA